MSDFLVALGLVLVIEGILYGGFPNYARRMALQAASTPEEVLRIMGLAVAVLGVLIVWLVRG